jgi:cytidylate kinase
VAALPGVRTALMTLQRSFRQAPGLVADGRDMGSVVFPDARLKIYLTATPEERAQRRYKQLISKEVDASMPSLLQDIRDRDHRDSNRAAAPLLKCAEAIEFDTTGIAVDAVVAKVLQWYQEHQKEH